MVKDLVSSHVGYTASDPGHHAGISSVNGGLAGSISLHTVLLNCPGILFMLLQCGECMFVPRTVCQQAGAVTGVTESVSTYYVLRIRHVIYSP